MGRRTKRGAIRDLLLYTLIGIGAVAGVTSMAVLTKVEPDPLFKWLGFALVTAIVFGDTVRANRRHWRSRRFWTLLGVFLAVQCGLGVPLLSVVARVPAIYWGIFFPLDYGALAALLAFFMNSRRD